MSIDTTPKATDPVNQRDFDLLENGSNASLGVMANGIWQTDPKKLLFSMSRYKFVAKMFEGKESALEIGSADAFFAPIVSQAVKKLTVTDFDPAYIEHAKQHLYFLNKEWHYEALVHDILKGPLTRKYHVAYSLDVMEHIFPEQEDIYLSNIIASLHAEGELIIGMPTLESQSFASPGSKLGHVNCKTGLSLKRSLEKYFHSAFLFSMNDEVVHTGFCKLAHYIFVVCANLKSPFRSP